MAGRKIKFGDVEFDIPEKLLSFGVMPIIGVVLVLWLFTGIYSV